MATAPLNLSAQGLGASASGATPEGKTSADGGLAAAGREFERLLVEQMLVAMEQSLDEGIFAQDGVSRDWYTTLFNQELSKEVTAGQGLGVARTLLSQLDGEAGAGDSLQDGLAALRTGGAGSAAGLASLDRAFELRRRERAAEQADPLLALSRRGALYQAARAESTSVERADKAGLKAMVREVAAEVGVDAELALALVQTESAFNPRAVSPKGALGLTQLMPDTARGLGVRDPLDPRQNVKGGLTYLKDMLERFQDRKLALAAYNAGPGAVERHDGIPPYRETRAYVARIEKLLKEDR